MDNTYSNTTPKSARSWAIMLLLSLGYLVLSYLLIGFKPEQLFLIGLVNVLYFASAPTRKFIIGFSIFIVYWIIFDYMKAFPNYWVNPVHIESLYNLEKQLFGIHTNGTVLTPNEFFLQHHYPATDVLAGIFYLCWIPVPLMFAGYLFYTNRKAFLHFSLAFVFINLIGFVIYYIYPAAPPWYVQEYGFTFHAATPGNTAGLARFDQFFGVQIFHGLYAKSSNVFAAMPSLHSAYPVIVLYYALKHKLYKAVPFFALVMVGIWSAAVYTSHHYVCDVLSGITCAVLGLILFEKVLLKNKAITSLINRMLKMMA